MNYIQEINCFYDKLETNPLSSNAVNLWHALMATANKTGWIAKFAVAISVLEVKTGLNKKAIERARNELQQKRYIQWNKRSGNQSAEYSLISLCDKTTYRIVSQSVSQNVVQDVPKRVLQAVAINKLNETKLKKKGNKKQHDEFIIPFHSDRFSELWNELLSSKKWINKSPYALQLSLSKLSKFDEDFACLLMEEAIERDWRGVVFPETTERYKQWKKEKEEKREKDDKTKETFSF